jgi:hypothetical protein
MIRNAASRTQYQEVCPSEESSDMASPNRVIPSKRKEIANMANSLSRVSRQNRRKNAATTHEPIAIAPMMKYSMNFTLTPR